MDTELTPELLLRAYAMGVFPMADDREGGAIYWYAPDPRAILPLDGFRASKNLMKVVRRQRFEVVTDRDFEGVMRACSDRPATWISDEIVEAYTALHRFGFAHSVECWLDGELAGGLYGVALGGAFFGESMFHRVRDASKVALVHLVEALRRLGYTLLDTQFTTSHLAQFGVIEIPRDAYEERLKQALRIRPKPWTTQIYANGTYS
ncbi:MAG: leucyl/phenylalanyl-tRNA--protein transferase [Rhodothermales bacterium]